MSHDLLVLFFTYFPFSKKISNEDKKQPLEVYYKKAVS